jgi:Flp pilus assembly protein, ATPase CpaF
MSEVKNIYDKIQKQIMALPMNEFMLSPDEESVLRSQKIEKIVATEIAPLAPALQKRIHDEFYDCGPLNELMLDEDITEILVNGPRSIWFEKKGQLQQHPDFYCSDLSFRNSLERISAGAKAFTSVEHPTADGSYLDFRVALVGAEITVEAPHLSLRRHPKNPWTFEKLAAQGWCDPSEFELFQRIIKGKKSFLVIGSTGAGKTSVLNSFLALLPENERVVVIEDTSEIALPNKASMKLLTREDPQGILPNIDQTQLVKRSLRLRPDRLAMGEIRGAEAKDFLMALATGHAGSFGTLHANDPQQALIRLEMLIQMGAPQWSLSAIRRLIMLSLDCIIVTGRDQTGARKFKGAHRLCSLEDHGFLIEPLYPV